MIKVLLKVSTNFNRAGMIYINPLHDMERSVPDFYRDTALEIFSLLFFNI
jgi:hypothetical protein